MHHIVSESAFRFEKKILVEKNNNNTYLSPSHVALGCVVGFLPYVIVQNNVVIVL